MLRVAGRPPPGTSRIWSEIADHAPAPGSGWRVKAAGRSRAGTTRADLASRMPLAAHCSRADWIWTI